MEKTVGRVRKKFDGDYFSLYTIKQRKNEAKIHASIVRDDGYKARVVYELGRGWVVYRRKK